MKKIFLPLFIILLVVFGFLLFLRNKNKSTIRKVLVVPTVLTTPRVLKNSMRITSTAFEDGGGIPKDYTCDGGNTNPPLEFLDIPMNTKSLALIVDDPDAPGGTWVHWVLYNMNPKITEIVSGGVPQGASLGKTSFGEHHYGGPCPPSGTHHYHFRLFALDAALDLSPQNATSNFLQTAMQGHIIEQTELVGLYSR